MKILIALFCIIALNACAPDTSDKYNSANNLEDVISLLNEKEYGKAIWLIETKYGTKPANPEMAYVLGQAYLGRAHFEPLAFAAAVSGPQDFSSPKAKALFPNCGEEPFSKKMDVKCVLKRVYLLSPAVDGNDFAHARELFRYAYPNPQQTPPWINTLIGIVETVSLVKRVGDLYCYAKGQKINTIYDLYFTVKDVPWLKRTATEAINEARFAVDRAENSSDKISKLLSGYKEDVWFQRIDGAVKFGERMGLPKTLDFIRTYLLKPEDEIRYGDSIDALRAILEAQEKAQLEEAK